MSYVLPPWQLLVGILAGWINQRQQEAIAHIRAENQVLREMPGQKRILLNVAQRCRLAVKGSGLFTYYALFVMKLAIRTVHCAGCTPNPNEAWMRQMALNMTDWCDGFLLGIRYWLMD